MVMFPNCTVDNEAAGPETSFYLFQLRVYQPYFLTTRF